MHADLPALPELTIPGAHWGQPRQIGQPPNSGLVLFEGRWVHATDQRGVTAGKMAIMDRGRRRLVRTPAAIVTSQAHIPAHDWATQAADRTERPATLGDAMNVAGYQWQGGAGPHDEALSRWLHEHMDINEASRVRGAPDDELDAALQPSSRPMLLYRGMPASAVPREGWVDPGYTTTSADPRVAQRYAALMDRGVVLEIHVPAGVGSAAIGNMPGDIESWDITDLEDSGEVLLQRGLRFRRLGRRGNTIRVEVVR